MDRIKITLPDGSEREYQKGVTIYEIAKDISEGLARVSLGAVVNGKILGLKDTIEEDANINILKFEDKEGKEIFRHTSSHILAQAVKRIFPDVKLAIGPAIDEGFYYDFDTEHRFTPEDLEKIEEVKEIITEIRNANF